MRQRVLRQVARPPCSPDYVPVCQPASETNSSPAFLQILHCLTLMSQCSVCDWWPRRRPRWRPHRSAHEIRGQSVGDVLARPAHTARRAPSVRAWARRVWLAFGVLICLRRPASWAPTRCDVGWVSFSVPSQAARATAPAACRSIAPARSRAARSASHRWFRVPRGRHRTP